MAGEWKRAVWTYDPVGSAHTPTTILNAFKSFLFQCGWEHPSWQPAAPSTVYYFVRTDMATQSHWLYNGDGYDQVCGLAVSYVAPNAIRVVAFVQNLTSTGAQVTTPGAGDATVVIDNTAPNNYLFVGGEDGLYVEVGRDGDPVNLGNFHVATHAAITEFRGTKNHTARWVSQGLVMDLSGELRFSENRNLRFVANDGSNHNHTAGLRPWVARGVTSLYTPNPSNGPRYYIAPRDSLFAAAVTSQYGSLAYIAAFAVPFSSQDSQYRISPLYVLHNSGEVAYTGANSTDAGNAVAPYSGYAALLDYREFRELRRIGVTDHTVLPYTTIQDATTNKYYRVCRVYDNGRYANFLVEWPTLAYITVIP